MQSSLKLTFLLAAATAFTAAAPAQNTGQLSENGWYSDDTRSDGAGAVAVGTNLISPSLTDDPEGTASGLAAHNAEINRQIVFGAAPGVVPTGTHRGAVHMAIAAGAGGGKSQISHRKDDGTGLSTGADAFGPATSMVYSWMGDGTVSVTASIKLGVKTADFGSTGVSGRTGENVWDKVFIYEPGNLNGGTSDGLWHSETVDYTTGKWWFFDRTAGASIIGTPMTLSDMSTSPVLVGGGPKTVADVYALITAPGAHVTSVQTGIGSGNAGGSVYVNELTTSFYRAGSTTTFAGPDKEYDQLATPEVIFGSGNLNGSFTTDRNTGVELSLRAKLRFDASNLPANIYNSNGDSTYTFSAGAPTGGAGWVAATTPVWNFEWSVNTDFDSTSGLLLDDLTYELGMDFDSSPATNYLAFDPIIPGAITVWDHAIGTNGTGNGGGTSYGTAPTYAAALAVNNVAQNSWNMEFFNDPPFDVFDPNDTGEYSFYLAAFSGGTEVARTCMTLIVERPLEHDQDVTSEVIFGSGNANGSFTTDRANGVEVGLRTKRRFNTPLNEFHSNGDGTFTWEADAATSGAGWITAQTPLWNFEWSVNTDYDASSGLVIDDLTYELGMDFDPSNGTNYLVFDPIAPSSTIPFIPAVVTPYWDHAIGTNATINGGGTSAIDVPTYLALIAANNLVQNSWNVEFYNDFPFDIFDPTVAGRYEFYLSASDTSGELARAEMTVVHVDGAGLTLEASSCQSDQNCTAAGTQVEVELWMRNVPDVTGFQAFLAFDDSTLTYEGTLSSYSSAPFGTHIQGISTAEVSAGELRLDGNAGLVGPTATDEDSLLATLVFTATSECDPVDLAFDLTQAFGSEVSFGGSPLVTSLVDSPSIVPDATPPLLTVPADITVAADAGVGSGCDSAVVTFTPTAVDTCSAVSIECFPPSGTAFAAGATTTVTCVATDACGNTDVDTFDVTVTLTNVVCLDVQLVGVATPASRCIRFVTTDCGTTTDITLAFDGTGLFSGEIEVPCGNWTSICAKDQQHTMWDSTTLSLSGDGTKYETSVTLDLEGGDTDNDGDVDINDVTLLLLQFGNLTAAGGCPWDTVTRDADFSNNGAVGSEDYTFLQVNWLTVSSCPCTIAAGSGRNNPDARKRMRVSDVSRNADFNADGWIDWRDVAIFERSNGLSDALSSEMRKTR
jgi:hypothetical protein